MRDTYNIIPFMKALLLHVVIFGSMFVAFDWSRNVQPITPMAITATLVTESAVVIPPPPVEREPEPEPVVVEPEPDLPDPAEQERIRLEEEARLLEAQREQQRIDRERELERQRQAELEAQRRAEEERRLEEQRRLADEERERQIALQREQNRLEEERLIAEAQQAAIDAEAERLEAQNSPEKRRYERAIYDRVRRFWEPPTTASDDLSCFVTITQLPNGEVVDVVFQQGNRCNGDAAVRRAVEAAVAQASPLPLPANPLLFEREIEIEFVRDD